jgi:hypothetical protein
MKKTKKQSRSQKTQQMSFAEKRKQELFFLLLIVFLSFSTALAVFFLDSTKDLRNRAADDITTLCNRSCDENRDCLENMVCHPYNRASGQKGVCRLDSNPDQDKCQQKQGIGFIVQVYNDKDADGRRGDGEAGQDWEFSWDRNKDEDWRNYQTYADKNGEGGRVAELTAGDVIRVRIKSKGGWEVTTPTEMQIVMATETTRVAYFGVRQPPTPTPVTKAAPATSQTKGGLGGEDSTAPTLGSRPSASPTPVISPSPRPILTPTPSPIVVQEQQEGLGFLGWLRSLFRRLYCAITKQCVIE